MFDRGLSQLLHVELHWLDIPQRVQYKLGIKVHRCLQNKAPQYLIDYCTLTSDVSSRQRLRSANRHQLIWRFHDTIAERLVVGLSPLRVWWNGTRFHTHSGTLREVSTASDRCWKLIFCGAKGRLALAALRDALYKATATTTTTPTQYLLGLNQIKSNQIELFYSAPKSWPESWPT